MYDYENLKEWECPGEHVIHEETPSVKYDSRRRFSLCCNGVEYAGRTYDLKTDEKTDIHRWETSANKDHMIEWLILLAKQLSVELRITEDELSAAEEREALGS